MSDNAIAREDWPEIRFRYLADVQKGGLPSSEVDLFPDAERAPYLTMEYLRGESSEPTLVPVDPTALMASTNSILLLWDGSNAGEFLRAKRGVVSSTSALVTPKKSVDPTYFYWACKSQEWRIRAETVGMGIPHVNGECLANIRLQLPPLTQQRAIADYLDRETARLDALVAAKERLLALLVEKRQAIISRAVTRGLGATEQAAPPAGDSLLTERNQSGVEAGRREDIAAVDGGDGVSWPVQKQLRHVFAVSSGATPASGNADYWDGEILWATPEDIGGVDGYWLRSTRRRITRAGYESCGASIAPSKSILLTKRAPIGQVALLAKAACSNQGCFLLIPNDSTDTRYYYYWLSVQTEYLQGLGRGSTFLELSTNELKSLQVPVPRLSQQRAIADYLDRETARLDALAAAVRDTITLLKERRAALIAAAVTGQIGPGRAA